MIPFGVDPVPVLYGALSDAPLGFSLVQGAIGRSLGFPFGCSGVDSAIFVVTTTQDEGAASQHKGVLYGEPRSLVGAKLTGRSNSCSIGRYKCPHRLSAVRQSGTEEPFF